MQELVYRVRTWWSKRLSGVVGRVAGFDPGVEHYGCTVSSKPVAVEE